MQAPSFKHQANNCAHTVPIPDSSWTLHNIYTYLRLYIWSIWYFDLKLLNKNVRNSRALNQQVSPWTLYNIKLV
jgi:hypothetical protein